MPLNCDSELILRKLSDAVWLGSMLVRERAWEMTQKFAANLGG
jgi:hypothetical protein